MKTALAEVSADIVALAEKCQYEQVHTWRVTYLALRLFDELKEELHLPNDVRRYLACGAMLHDIGWIRSGKGHHKTAYEIILENRPPSLTAEEAEIVALIARYHRKSPPSTDHAEFARLSVLDREIVRKLAALLRIADGLDRGHRSNVLDLWVELSPLSVTIWLKAERPPDVEIWGAKRKLELLAELLSRDVHFSVRPAI